MEKLNDDDPKGESLLNAESQRIFDHVLDEIKKEGDRGFVILQMCMLDYYLERLLRAFFLKEKGVDNLFDDDRLLQSFSSKRHIAYYSGLIPKVVYQDLGILNKMRNMFAHEIKDELSFNSPKIISLANSFLHIPSDSKAKRHPPQMKFLLIVTRISSVLSLGADILLDVEKRPFYDQLIIDAFGKQEDPIIPPDAMSLEYQKLLK